MDRLHAVELWWGSVCKCALPTDSTTVLAVLEQSENIQSAGWFNSCRHSRDFKLKVPYYAHFQVPTFYLECWKCFTYFNVHKTVYFTVIGPFLQTFIHPLSECSVLVPPPPHLTKPSLLWLARSHRPEPALLSVIPHQRRLCFYAHGHAGGAAEGSDDTVVTSQCYGSIVYATQEWKHKVPACNV